MIAEDAGPPKASPIPTRNTTKAIQYRGVFAPDTNIRIRTRNARMRSAPIITYLRFKRSAHTPPNTTKPVPLNTFAAITKPKVVVLPPESIITIASAIGKAVVPMVTMIEERKSLRKSLKEKSAPGSKSALNFTTIKN